jgi:hypothetical protein
VAGGSPLRRTLSLSPVARAASLLYRSALVWVVAVFATRGPRSSGAAVPSRLGTRQRLASVLRPSPFVAIFGRFGGWSPPARSSATFVPRCVRTFLVRVLSSGVRHPVGASAACGPRFLGAADPPRPGVRLRLASVLRSFMVTVLPGRFGGWSPLARPSATSVPLCLRTLWPPFVTASRAPAGRSFCPGYGCTFRPLGVLPTLFGSPSIGAVPF